jgi:hypothetical protein
MTRTLRLAVVVLCVPATIWAHTLGDPNPFHLSPGDHFTIPVTGGTFANVADVTVRFTPVGGGSSTDQAPESVVANTSVGVRVPVGLAVGQYDVKVLVSGTPNDAPDKRVWVRLRPFRFVGKSRTYLPNQPCATGSAPGCTFPDPDYKDSNFGDVDNDGFLDVFSANSQSGQNIDRLHINQRGRAPGTAACPTDFCDETATKYENTVSGVPNSSRTYDADMVDLDLDGDIDLVRVDNNSSAPLRLFINDGTGRFVDRTITRSGIGSAMLPPLADVFSSMGSGMIATVDQGDADGDGRPDLLLCNWGGSSARTVLLLNRLSASGRFEIANTACSGSGDAFCQTDSMTNRGCGFGHFNTDNRRDIILAGLDPGGDDVVLLNTGNNGSGVPQFSVDPNWIRGPAPGFGSQRNANAGNVAVADLDGDGDDDVAISSPTSSEPQGRILWNDQGTRLVELDTSRYPVPNGTYEVEFTDVDRDGDIDIFYSPYLGGNGQAVLINRGGRDANMKFEAVAPADLWFAESPGGSVVTAPGSYLNFTLSLNGGDYDLDGDADALSAGFENVRVWRSDLFDQPGEDRDWIFALDRTRSMITGRDFFEPAKNVIRTFLGQRRAGDAVGLVAFDYTGPTPNNPNAPDDNNKAQVLAQLGARTPAELQTDVAGLSIGSCTGFCTAIGWAINKARDVALGGPDPNGREKVIVLATDGAQNQGPHPDTIIPSLPSHVRLYTVALGSDTDDRMLSALATNGGKFHFAGRSTDYASVQSKWRDVDEDIEAHATGKQRLHPVSGFVGFSVLRDHLFRSPLLKGLVSQFPIEGPAVLAPRDFFVVDPADGQVRFTLSWRHDSRTNGMVVVDPKGRTLPIPGDNRIRERRTPRLHVVEVLDPLSGVWSIQPAVTGDSGPGKLTAIASSRLRLTAELPFPLHYVGEVLRLRADLADNGVGIAGTTGQARITAPSKAVEMVTGTRVNDRTLEFASAALSEPGTYDVEVTVVGPPNRPFTRTWQSGLHVAQPTPGEVDLRRAELALDRTNLRAGETTNATLRLVRRDGASLDGAKVTFVADRGTFEGAVQALGGGRYRQTLKAGTFAGPGVAMARVDLFRLPNRAAFEVRAGAVAPGVSTFTLILGIQKLCTNQRGRFVLRVVPLDADENPIVGARVQVDNVSGPRLQWDGPVRPVGQTGIYERAFWGPGRAGTFEFRATVDGVALTRTIAMDVFPADSAEGRALGCVAIAGMAPFDFGALWWLWLLLLLLLLLLLWIWFRRQSAPATP